MARPVQIRDYKIGAVSACSKFGSDDKGKCVEWPVAYRPPIPPIGCTGTCSDTLYTALYKHPHTERFATWERDQASASDLHHHVHFEIWITDQGPGNVKLAHFIPRPGSTELTSESLSAWKSCSTHDQSLIEASCTVQMSSSYVSEMFCTCNFIAMGKSLVTTDGRWDGG